MATGYSSADKLRDVDYTRSHRSPPPIPLSPRGRTALNQREAFSAAVATAIPGSTSEGRYSEQLPEHRSLYRANTSGGTASKADAWPIVDNHETPNTGAGVGEARRRAASTSEGTSGRPRRGSFNFLKRTNTNSSRKASLDQPERTFYVAEPSAPPLPKTLFAQAQQEAASRPSQERTGSMLRKVSGMGGGRKKQEEQERLKKEAAAAALPRQPPHLPSLSPLPGMSPFSEERPDSVAIFNTSYTTSPNSTRPAANFSRPNQPHAMPPSSAINSSSSPGYSSGRADSGINSSSPPIPHVKANGIHSSGEYVAADLPESISMTNRGRFSYASTATNVNSFHSPRRIRRKKDPTPFNILIIGAKNSGKSSFISFLKNSLSLPPGKLPHGHEPELENASSSRGSSSFSSTYLESEIDSERIGLTLWDSKGLEKNVVDLQCRELTAFVESKFEETFAEEQKVMRTPGVKDTHIHCVFLVLDPVRLDSHIGACPNTAIGREFAAALDDDLDLQVMRALWGKTTVIPILGKADTLTVGHMSFLKRAVWDAIKAAKLDPLEALELEDDSEEDSNGEAEGAGSGEESDTSLPKVRPAKAHKRQSSLSVLETIGGDMPYLPMSILSPDPYDVPKKGEKVGRRFPWGLADPYDSTHCDFGRLRDSVFSEWRVELRELSRSRWYENWRTSRLKNLPGTRQRIQGGVTPVASVPRGGRIASQTPRQASLQVDGADYAVERKVSNISSSPSMGMARSSPSPLVNGKRDISSREVSGASVSGSARGGARRESESNAP
ncbi:Putative P-loop containing nucleoside triphosphate hydrolase [Septoria linicola]|uniref:P-loop containing nucleoside triphosphate hydrolase n=1 Tax=Septoria linicola TaxID=215465 RepID=A0A9Q9AJY8_9PEZI|nr:putative P-loop containing nucleoside triphosphate hydrolase [Septoria linicola]USW50767.1 Putative P-loop containing nucleoside triphosphate hydrolase [Septoria linicola]